MLKPRCGAGGRRLRIPVGAVARKRNPRSLQHAQLSLFRQLSLHPLPPPIHLTAMPGCMTCASVALRALRPLYQGCSVAAASHTNKLLAGSSSGNNGVAHAAAARRRLSSAPPPGAALDWKWLAANAQVTRDFPPLSHPDNERTQSNCPLDCRQHTLLKLFLALPDA